MSETVTLTIDGREVTVPQGTTILEAAQQLGIEIPLICHHLSLESDGLCRVCSVDAGYRTQVAACVTECQEGMEIETDSDEVRRGRRTILEMLASAVDLEKAPEIQVLLSAYGADMERFSAGAARERPVYDDNPFYIRDYNQCVNCWRCVQVCREVIGANALGLGGRGFSSHITTALDKPLVDSTCVFCGTCVQLCPTGALAPATGIDVGRDGALEHIETTCGYCGVGCKIEYVRKDGEIIYAEGVAENSVNGETLCTKGRYGWDFATHPDRLASPMLRRDVAYEMGLTDEPWQLPDKSPLEVRKPDVNDSFIPVDWETALRLVGEKFAETAQAHGPDAFMGLASARCSNEENYLFQKFMRAGIGTNNLDHCARL